MGQPKLRARGPAGLALVTGGAGGIGQAICRRLHAAGWGVAIGFVSRERAERFATELAGEVPAIAVPFDMADRSMIDASIDALIESNGAIDAIVFCAGASSRERFVDSDPKSWLHQLEVNFSGPVRASYRALPAMRAVGAGALIAITSESAKVGDSEHAVYAAAKNALAEFLTAIALEYATDGIRTGSVAPGPVDTELLHHSLGGREQSDRALAALQRLIPLRRFAEPDEVAAAVEFLVNAGPTWSGLHLSVGGGVTMQ